MKNSQAENYLDHLDHLDQKKKNEASSASQPVQVTQKMVQVVQVTGLLWLLDRLDTDGVRMVWAEGKAKLRGGLNKNDAGLLQAVKAHRPHLVRLARSDARVDGGSWRRELARADNETREAWTLVAHGHEGQGITTEAAEWLAWVDVMGKGE